MFNFFKKNDSELKALREENAVLRSRLTQGNIPEEKLPERWKPELDQGYYSISAAGNVRKFQWRDSSVDHELYDFYNVFKTKEEADDVALRRKYTQLYHSYGRDYDPDRDNYTAGYDIPTNAIVIIKTPISLQGFAYFNSKEHVLKVIEALGEFNVIKYVFGADVIDVVEEGEINSK